MNKGKNTSTEKKVNPFFEKLEQLSKVQRISIWAGVMILVVAGFIYFSYLPSHQQIDKLKVDLAKVEKDLDVAKKNARELDTYRKKIEDAEVQLKEVMRALPEKEEIPTLLTGISRAGESSGLVFLSFQMRPEVKKDFYAEIPISLRLTGDYHGVAIFFEEVAKLNRIVNIRDITMTPNKDGKTLTTACTAVTYKFIEGSTDAKKNPPKKK